MEPLLPTARRGELRERAAELLRAGAALGACVHPRTRDALARLLRMMNSYYSNRIEGQATRPLDIERALARGPGRGRASTLRQLAVAHVEVQEALEARLAAEPDLPVCSPDLLVWIHAELYRRLPEELRVARDPHDRLVPMRPGALRTWKVVVGDHVAPAAESVAPLLDRFARAYAPAPLDPLDRVLAAAASHHRLAWIHPFPDGNGRVARLFTHAYLTRAEVGAHGLWTLSRGLARQRERYFAALADADSPRRGDLDGRGNLSDAALADLCAVFLDVANDQVAFMSSLLQLDTLDRRIRGWVERLAASRELRPQAAHVLTELVIRGSLARGEVARVAGMPERTARLLIGELLSRGFVTSESPKGPLSIRFSVSAASSWLPRLFPEDEDAGSDA